MDVAVARQEELAVEEAERRIREAEAEARAGGLVSRSATKVTVAEREAMQRGGVMPMSACVFVCACPPVCDVG